MEFVPQHVDGEDKQQDVHGIEHVARLCGEQREPLLAGNGAEAHSDRW